MRLIPVSVIFSPVIMIGLMTLVGDCVSVFGVGDCDVAVIEGDADVAVGALVAVISDGDTEGAIVVTFIVGVAEGESVGAVVAIDGAVVATVMLVGAVVGAVVFVGSVGNFVGVIEFDIVYVYENR